MIGFTIRRRIDAPADLVFAAVSDLPGAPKRIRAIRRVEVLTPGPVRVGTRFRETRVMFKREATQEMTVVALEPGRLLAFGADSCGCRVRGEFRVHPAGDVTDLEMALQAEPLTWLARVVAFLTKPMIASCRKSSEQDLDDMKAAIEAERVAVS